MEERRRRGISWIGERVAVAVSVMGFGSVVESYSCANPISGLLRVYFSHTRRADRGIERGSLSRASRSPRDRYRSLFLAINDRPACPVYFILSLSLSPFLLKLSKPIQTIFADRIFPDILCSKIRSNGADLRSTYLPTPPLDRPLYFFRRGIFFFDLLRRGCRSGRAKGRRSTRRGCTEGDSSVYLRIACRLSIEPFVQPRVKSLRIDSKIRSRSSVVRKRCGVTNDKNLYFYLRREKKGKKRRRKDGAWRGEGSGIESMEPSMEIGPNKTAISLVAFPSFLSFFFFLHERDRGEEIDEASPRATIDGP